MSLPVLPTLPIPPVIIQPAPTAPSTPPNVVVTPIATSTANGVSTSASDLSASTTSNQNNSNVTQNRVSNVNVNNQNIQGGSLTVGNIRVETAQLYFNASVNPTYGEAVISGGIVIPLGGHSAYRAANTIARVESGAARGNLCMSVRNNRMTRQQVEDVFEKDSKWLFSCIDDSPVPSTVALKTQQVQKVLSDSQPELDVLKAEIAELRAQLANRRQTVPVLTPPVQGLW
jgi:hypothetical protein